MRESIKAYKEQRYAMQGREVTRFLGQIVLHGEGV
jgi:hypothetical protein